MRILFLRFILIYHLNKKRTKIKKYLLIVDSFVSLTQIKTISPKVYFASLHFLKEKPLLNIDNIKVRLIVYLNTSSQFSKSRSNQNLFSHLFLFLFLIDIFKKFAINSVEIADL